MLISVIIPVFNVEQYLTECINSVLNQNNVQLEVILVDDGSTDTCGIICDKFALQDSRVKVIHQKNGGLSEARNSGLDIAVGDFVVFLDGDDLWSDSYALRHLIERQNQTNADVVNYSYVRWFEDTGKKQPYVKNIPDMPLLCSKKAQLEYLTSQGLYIASACNKLIRRTVLDGLYFRKGVYSEDIEWCAELLLRAKSMDFVFENFYMYRQHSASIRHTINRKKCDDLADNILRCIKLTEQADQETKVALLRYLAFQLGTFFLVQAQAKIVPVDSIEKLKDLVWLLKYHGNNKKLRVLELGCRLFGYKGLCRIIRLAYRK